MPVYLIHFDKPYEHAEHYVGFVTTKDNLPLRLEHHRKNRGARLMNAVTQAGIDWAVVKFWPKADRKFERRLKGRSARRYCPKCSPDQSAGTWFNKEKHEDF